MAFVVFAGQSNALGYGMSAATLPVAAPRLDWLTYIWNNDTRWWEPMMPGVNTGTAANPDAWGPEASFALAFRESRPFEPLFIVKSVKGSTGLAADPDRGDWSPQSDGELFDLTARRIAEARAGLPGAPVNAVFLFQGETDAFDPLAAAAYGDNLRGWLAAIRAEWMGDPQGEVVIGKISGAPAYVEAVRAAQDAVDAADPFARAVDGRGLAMQADGLHYAADGYAAIGRDYFTLYDAWV